MSLIALTAVAFGLRVVGLDSGLWFDEIMIVRRAIRPPLVELLSYPHYNLHPFFSLSARFSVALFGESPWALRLPALLFGVASVPLLYRLGARLGYRREGLLAAALLTVSYHHIWFSQNTRGYTALLFWTLLSTDLLLVALRSADRRKWISYALVATLGLYTHLTMTFVVSIHAGWTAWSHLRRHSPGSSFWGALALGFLPTTALSAVLYAPLFRNGDRILAVAPGSGRRAATPIWALEEAMRGFRVGLGSVAFALAGAMLLLGLWHLARHDSRTFLLFTGPGVLLLTVTVLLGRPTYPRHYFLVAGFGALTIACGASVAAEGLSRARPSPGGTTTCLGRRSIVAAIVGVLLLYSLAMLPRLYRLPKQDFLGALRFVEATRRADDRVAVVSRAASVYIGYYGMPWIAVDDVATLADARANADRLFVVYTFPQYIAREAPALLRMLEADCLERRAFPGTLGAGEVFVCQLPGSQAEVEVP